MNYENQNKNKKIKKPEENTMGKHDSRIDERKGAGW